MGHAHADHLPSAWNYVNSLPISAERRSSFVDPPLRSAGKPSIRTDVGKIRIQVAKGAVAQQTGGYPFT